MAVKMEREKERERERERERQTDRQTETAIKITTPKISMSRKRLLQNISLYLEFRYC